LTSTTTWNKNNERTTAFFNERALIVQVPSGSAIDRQLRNRPPSPLKGEDVLVQAGPTDDEGNLEEMAGQVVLSVRTVSRGPGAACRGA
jgi:hypothetical protein